LNDEESDIKISFQRYQETFSIADLDLNIQQSNLKAEWKNKMGEFAYLFGIVFDPHQWSSTADLEAVLADVSYLMAMEMSKQTPESSKKIVLPDSR
jgi:hypothetical protein